MAALDRIRPFVEEKLRSLGLELYDIKHIQAGPHSIVRVFIDRENGASIAECEKASRELSMLLDVENFSDRPYTLEVSTPGIDKPLVNERDYQRSINRILKVNIKKESSITPKLLTGKLLSLTASSIRIASQKEEMDIPFGDIISSKIEVQFK